MPLLPRLASIAQSLPGTCQVCSRWPAQPVCHACATRFAAPRPRCQTCARPVRGPHLRCGACLTEKHPPFIDICLAAVDYAYPWDQLIARFKFRQEPALAHPMAELMLRHPLLPGLLKTCQWIVPVPVSSERLAERGYNQAWELAKALRAQNGPSSARGWATALHRQGHAPDQHNLPAQQRASNLKGAFKVPPQFAHRLRGAHVLLVDDVSTTGTTLRTAAACLRQAGAQQVSAAVFAHTAID